MTLPEDEQDDQDDRDRLEPHSDPQAASFDLASPPARHASTVPIGYRRYDGDGIRGLYGRRADMSPCSSVIGGYKSLPWVGPRCPSTMTATKG